MSKTPLTDDLAYRWYGRTSMKDLIEQERELYELCRQLERELADTYKQISHIAPYQEHHFQRVQDVGVAWNNNRVWVCLNGVALLRAKVIDGKFFVSYSYVPEIHGETK